MAIFRSEKVVSALPDPLEPDTLYYVRTGAGFDLYLSDTTGSVAYQQNAPRAWIDYAAQWSSEPSEIGSTANGAVFEYTLDGTARYRLVPDPYDATQDAFYADWDGTTLSNLITTRG